MYKLMGILRNIKRRIKRDMGAYYLTLGAIFLPFGFIVLLEYHDKVIAGIAFAIGMLTLLLGIKTIQKDERENERVIYNRWQLQTEILHEILKEIKSLREVQNERDDESGKSD